MYIYITCMYIIGEQLGIVAHVLASLLADHIVSSALVQPNIQRWEESPIRRRALSPCVHTLRPFFTSLI